MADSDRAKADFSDILNSIERKYEIIHTKWTEDKLFEAKFRTQITRDSDDFNGLCDEWVEVFSEVTNTVWAKKISNTGPKIRFRKQYQCWTQGGKVVHKELLFDARKCKGTLDIKVLTDNPLTRRKNKHIRMGLNVVVKINFIHLHPVDISKPFTFFVHNCEPQPEPPKTPVQPNERLPQLVAEMVQKGLNSSSKSSEMHSKAKADYKQSQNEQHQGIYQPNILSNIEVKSDESQQLIHDSLQLQHDIHQQPHHHHHHQTIQLVQNVPLQNMESIKLLPPHLQQYTQVVVSGPQLDMSEPMLMCQPLMFDTSQVIPVSSHTLPSHFVQVHSHNLHNQ